MGNWKKRKKTVEKIKDIKDAKTVHYDGEICKIVDGVLSKHLSKHSCPVYGSASVVINEKQSVTLSLSDKAEKLRCSADSCSLFN